MQIILTVFAITALLAMLLPPTTCRAAWEPGGNLVTWMGYGGRTYSPVHVAIPEGPGSCLVSIRLGPDLWRVDANGGTAHLWPVPDTYPGAAGYNPGFASDGAGGFIVVWSDSRDGAQAVKLYAQHITAAGTIAPGWPDHGVVLSGAGVSNALVVADGSGGAFVAWTDASTPYAQHVSGDRQVAAPGGAPVAGPPAVAQTYGYVSALVGDGTGGAILVWVDLRNAGADPYNYDLFAQRVDRNLNLAWGPAGAEVTTAAYGQDHPVALDDGLGGAFIAWHDRRNSTSALTSNQKQDIYAVRLTSSGAVAPGWAPGGSPVRISSKWADDVEITGDGAGGALISSLASQAEGLEIADAAPSGALSVRYQALDPAANGFAGNNNGRRHGVIADGTGGVFIAWAGTDGDFVFHLGADGLAAPGWTENARVDGVANTWTGSLSLAPDGAGGAFVVFERCRVVYPHQDYEKLLYATRVTGGNPATVDLGPAPAVQFALRGARPNPAGRDLAVAFVLPDGAPARLELADLAGRRIAAREVGAMGAGEHVLRLGDSHDLAPGVYIVRLTRGGRALTARLAVIR